MGSTLKVIKWLRENFRWNGWCHSADQLNLVWCVRHGAYLWSVKRWTTGWNIITSFLITSGTLLRGTIVILGRLLTVKRCVVDLGGNLKPVGWICVRSGGVSLPLMVLKNELIILVGSSGGSLVGVISIENWVVPHHVILGQLNRGRNIFICFTKLRS